MYLPKWLLIGARFVLMSWASIALSSVFALQIGIIDELAVSSSSQALLKQNTDKLDGLQSELKALRKQFEILSLEFSKNKMVMDEKTQQQKQKELIKLERKFQTKMFHSQKQQEIMQDQLAQQLLDAATQVAKQKKLNLVLGRIGGVLYADSDFDVTKDAIKTLSRDAVVPELQQLEETLRAKEEVSQTV